MKPQKKQSILKKLTPYAGSKKYLFSLSLFLSALSSALGLLPFVFIWLIAKELFASTESITFQSVEFYAWMSLASAFAAMLVYFFSLMSSHLAAFHVEVGMRKVGMSKIINMPLGFFDKNQTGKMRKVIDDNASQTHTFLAHQLPDLASTIIAPLIILALMFIIDWRMGLVSLIPIVLGAISIRFMMSKAGEEFRKQYMDSLEEMSSEAVEYVRGIPVVKTYGQSVHSFKQFVNSIMKYKEMVVAYTIMWQKPMSFYTIIMQSTAFFLAPFAILFIAAGGNVALTIINFIFYLILAPNFTLLFMRSMYFQNYANIAKETIERFDNILNYSKMEFPPKSTKPVSYTIEFKDVVFAYDGADSNAVDGISFTVQQGETVALVGASGGGKTTIARLAARFWDVNSGHIIIGGQDIKSLSNKELMKNTAFVFQNTKLFKKSLRENIIYGNPDASEKQIQPAIDLSQSREIINNLPEGLDTLIGKEGTYLSGGEQQRIALARAIIKDAPIVLLDEATAFADPENEHIIQKALHELSKNKTTLMIAHRLTSIQNANKILVIEKGKIAEQGTHNDLLAFNGIYKKMWEEYQMTVKWTL
ncbi:ABC transporter ATP-binding protein [Saccharicrinis fermentans]|uniref:Lipid A export ATP-binding/permease protein MsbA n=1 Tax=Saccharicrinis fermentans DSM 9555 = JCM 21142 TaxID=869213 RepID=W7Y8U1_9BACT|nr:ABC transporter ATP-binding protein [Saccharicrinis fermentans]GAF04667.1 lipid A export ATP-binding/permease protein MsbA [Saccharicrinis fermentans DSM 9555 = JCM 21142]